MKQGPGGLLIFNVGLHFSSRDEEYYRVRFGLGGGLGGGAALTRFFPLTIQRVVQEVCRVFAGSVNDGGE